MFFTLSIVDRSYSRGDGYIAGKQDGIVTVAGKATSRAIYLYALYNYKPMVLVAKTWSTAQGNYIFKNLDTSMRYLIMVRDYKKEFEPFVWDYVKPADDLTITEQQALWQTWQTN